MRKNLIAKFIDEIVSERIERTKDVLFKIDQSMEKLDHYNKYLDQLEKEYLDLNISKVKKYFSNKELEYFSVNRDKFILSRKKRLLKIITFKQNELGNLQIKKIISLKELTQIISQKYVENKEIIYYYLYEQNMSEDIQRIRRENASKRIILSEPSEFTQSIIKMRNKNTRIKSISQYIPITLISEYEKLENEIEDIRNQISILSDMRVFVDIYFELIPNVISSLQVFDFQYYKTIRKDSKKIQFPLIKDNTFDVIRLAYFYIHNSFFRNNYIEEYSIQQQELEEENRNKEILNRMNEHIPSEKEELILDFLDFRDEYISNLAGEHKANLKTILNDYSKEKNIKADGVIRKWFGSHNMRYIPNYDGRKHAGNSSLIMSLTKIDVKYLFINKKQQQKKSREEAEIRYKT